MDLYTFTAFLNGVQEAIDQGDPAYTSTAQFFCETNSENRSHGRCTVQVPLCSIDLKSGTQWTCPWPHCGKSYTFRLNLPGNTKEVITNEVELANSLHRRFTGLNGVVESRTARLEEATDGLMNAIGSLKKQDYPRRFADEDAQATTVLNKIVEALENISAATDLTQQTVMGLHRGVCQVESDSVTDIIAKMDKIYKSVSALWNIGEMSDLPSRLSSIDDSLYILQKGRRGSKRPPSSDGGLRVSSSERRPHRKSFS